MTAPQVPACVQPWADTEDEGDQGDGDEDRAGDVQLRTLPCRRLLEYRGREDEHDDGDDDVDEERPAPADGPGE